MIKDTFDLAFVAENFGAVLGALPVTILITILSLASGWLVGLLAAFGKIKGPAFVRVVLRFLTDVIRGIPTVVLLYVVYFGLPILFESAFGISLRGWSKTAFVVIALAIELGTSSSEMFRSAYNSLKKGQLEAARALGYTGIQTFIHVIFPQGVFVILPNLGSAVLSIVQATALVYTLGVFDILGKARQIDTNVAHVKTFEMYFVVAIIYWALALIIGAVFRYAERRMGKGKAVVA